MRKQKIERFKKDYKEKCLAIMEEILEHPISEVFYEPVDPVADEVPDYFDIIKNPSDLSTVQNKLVTDQYQSFDDFKRDMNLIWENAILYNGRGSFPAFIADQLGRIFQRRISQIEVPTPEQWVSEYLKARSIMVKLFRSPPKSVASVAQTDESADDKEECKYYHVSDEDLAFFQQMAPIFKDPANRSELIKLVNENEPSVEISESNFRLDLSTLSPRTLSILKNWIADIHE